VNTRPIINVRHQLRWHHRLYSDASTLALWSAWLWLCRPAILGALGMLGVAFGLRHPSPTVARAVAMPSVEEMALLLIGVAALLLLWNRLSREPAMRPRVNLLPDFERHFGLDADQIAAARDSRRCVVHHDEQGRIIGLQSSAAARGTDNAAPFRAAA